MAGARAARAAAGPPRASQCLSCWSCGSNICGPAATNRGAELLAHGDVSGRSSWTCKCLDTAPNTEVARQAILVAASAKSASLVGFRSNLRSFLESSPTALTLRSRIAKRMFAAAPNATRVVLESNQRVGFGRKTDNTQASFGVTARNKRKGPRAYSSLSAVASMRRRASSGESRLCDRCNSSKGT